MPAQLPNPACHWHCPPPTGSGPPTKVAHPAQNDNRVTDTELDQYYTRRDVAELFYRMFQEHFDPAEFQMVEPSAGQGAFYRLLPSGSIGYDLEPKCAGIRTADFLTTTMPIGKRIAIIGNPPFGKNASVAIRFFNHAAWQSNVIAMILPRSFRKASIENRLDRDFHLLREAMVPADAFIFRDRPYDVPAVFQIWERRQRQRWLRHVETKHPDFAFTTPDRAHFAVQRVGARAGRVHRNLKRSTSAHYFIRVRDGLCASDIETVMTCLDFASVVGDVAGNPSLAKSELISLYREFAEVKARGYARR